VPASATVAILAGGRATRLGGVPKPLLVVGGQRIIDRQLAVLRPLFDELIVVTNDPAPFADLDLPLVPDRRPGQGPLAGIDAALAHFATRTPSASVLCVAGDMPFLHPALLRHLRDAAPALALVPRLAGRPEPLCARYGPAFSPHVTTALSDGRLAMHALLDHLRVTYVEEAELLAFDPTLQTFANINTPDDLAALDISWGGT